MGKFLFNPITGQLDQSGGSSLTLGTTAGTACEGNDSRLSDSRTPTAHSSSHSTSGSDPISPSSIGAQSLFTSASAVWTSNGNDQTLTAGRAVVVTANNYFAASVNLTLPTTGNLAGDVFVVKTTVSPSGNIVIRKLQFGSVFETLATITANGQSYRFIAASGTGSDTWQIDPVYTHNHAASAITSGVFDNARINFAAPSAIGSTTASTGAFTTLSASGAITAAAGTAGTPTTPATALGVQWSGLGGSDIAAVYGTYAGAGKVGIGVGTSGILTEVASFALGGIALNRSVVANNGTLTASAPVLDLSQTWNNAAVTFTGLRFNVTNTASAATSPLIDLQVGGVSRMRMTRGGVLHVSEHSLSGIYSPAPVWTGSSGGLVAATNLAVGANLDTILERDAADTLAQRRSTNAQTFRLYNTFTDASNYERGFMRWNASVLEIGTEALGTGSSRDVAFFRGGARQLTLLGNGAVRLESTGQLAWSSRGAIFMSADGVMWLSNNAGTDFGRLAFGGTTSSFPALKRSSTTLQVRLADDSAFAPLEASGLTLTNTNTFTVTANATSTLVGGAAVIRLDGVRLAFATGGTDRLVFSGGGDATFASASLVQWLQRIRLSSPADGQFLVANNAGTDFDRVQLGGTTSSFPAIKRSSAILQARLADDSGYTVLDAQLRAQGTAPATSGATGTAGDIRYDADYIYVCTATNTWKRAAIATW